MNVNAVLEPSFGAGPMILLRVRHNGSLPLVELLVEGRSRTYLRCGCSRWTRCGSIGGHLPHINRGRGSPRWCYFVALYYHPV